MKTLKSSTWSKENRDPGCTGFPINRVGVRCWLGSLETRSSRLQGLINDEIEKSEEILNDLDTMVQQTSNKSNEALQQESSKIQDLQNSTLELCRKRASLSEAEIGAENYEKRGKASIKMLQEQIAGFKSQQHQQQMRGAQKIQKIENSLTDLTKDSEQKLYVLLGESQALMDTLENRIASFTQLSTSSLNSIEEEIEFLCQDLDNKSNAEINRWKRDSHLIEALIQKLIHKMMSL